MKTKAHPKRILIIGGVAGGASAAARARRLSEEATITILEKGPYVSFANCGLPYALGGVISERDRLLLQTPESLKARLNLDVKVHTQALSIDRTKKSVLARNELTGEMENYSYDHLILSMGAEAIRPPLPGIGSRGVFTLQTIQDLDGVQEWIKDHGCQSACVIGGGFIGIETAENLVHRGVKVTLIERGDQVFTPVDPDMAELIHHELKQKGITLLTQSELKAIEPTPEHRLKLNIQGKDASFQISSDLLIMAIGVRPRSKIAQEAGLTLGKTGGVQVDSVMRTSDPAIYAVGDLIETLQPQFSEPAYIPLAGPANRQGRIAANHIFGQSSAYRGTWGTSICQVFDLTVATTGLSRKALRRMGKPFEWVSIHPQDHAGYYPGATPMTLQLTFEPGSGRILGGQIVGKNGVDKRIDVLSVAIQAGMSVFDLEHLELAYAPPYGSAKDPINMAGFVASNLLRGDTEILHAQDLAHAMTQGVKLLDVRTTEEHEAGHIPGSVHLPIESLRSSLHQLDPKQPLVVYCQVGFRGYLAYRILKQKGFQVRNLDGGFKTWKSLN
ncbi:MAG: FAD-dependent oxidoreductase [Bdellovibrionia bacterium]